MITTAACDLVTGVCLPCQRVSPFSLGLLGSRRALLSQTLSVVVRVLCATFQREDKRVCDAYFSISSLCTSPAHAFQGWIGLEHKTKIAGELLGAFRILEKKPLGTKSVSQGTGGSMLTARVSRLNLTRDGLRDEGAGGREDEEMMRRDRAPQGRGNSPDSAAVSSSLHASGVARDPSCLPLERNERKRQVDDSAASERLKSNGVREEGKELNGVSPDESSPCGEAPRGADVSSPSVPTVSQTQLSSSSASSGSFVDLLTFDFPAPASTPTHKEKEREGGGREPAAVAILKSAMHALQECREGVADECLLEPTIPTGSLSSAKERVERAGAGDGVVSLVSPGESEKKEGTRATLLLLTDEDDGGLGPGPETVKEKQAERLDFSPGDETLRRVKAVPYKAGSERHSEPVLLLSSGTMEWGDEDTTVPSTEREINGVQGYARLKEHKSVEQQQERGRTKERMEVTGRAEPRARARDGRSRRSEGKGDFGSVTESCSGVSLPHDKKTDSCYEKTEGAPLVDTTTANSPKPSTGKQRRPALATQREELHQSMGNPCEFVPLRFAPAVPSSPVQVEGLSAGSRAEKRKEEDETEELAKSPPRGRPSEKAERSSATGATDSSAGEESWTRESKHAVWHEDRRTADPPVALRAGKGAAVTRREGQEGGQEEEEHGPRLQGVEWERRRNSDGTSSDAVGHAEETRTAREISDEAAAALREAFEETERKRLMQAPMSRRNGPADLEAWRDEARSVGRGAGGSNVGAGPAPSSWPGTAFFPRSGLDSEEKGMSPCKEPHSSSSLLNRAVTKTSSGASVSPSCPSSGSSPGAGDKNSTAAGLGPYSGGGREEAEEADKSRYVREALEVERRKPEEILSCKRVLGQQFGDGASREKHHEAGRADKSLLSAGDAFGRSDTEGIDEPSTPAKPRPADVTQESQRSFFAEEFRIPSFPSSSEPSLEALPELSWQRGEPLNATHETGGDSAASAPSPEKTSGASARTRVPSRAPVVASLHEFPSHPTPSSLSPVPLPPSAAADKKRYAPGSFQKQSMSSSSLAPEDSTSSQLGFDSAVGLPPELAGPSGSQAAHRQTSSAHSRATPGSHPSFRSASTGRSVTSASERNSVPACLPPPSDVGELRCVDADSSNSFPGFSSASSTSSPFASALASSSHSSAVEESNPQEAAHSEPKTRRFVPLTSDSPSVVRPSSVEPLPGRKERSQDDREGGEEACRDSSFLHVPIFTKARTPSSSSKKDKKAKTRSFSLVTSIRSHGSNDRPFPGDEKASKTGLVGAVKGRLAGLSVGSVRSSLSSSSAPSSGSSKPRTQAQVTQPPDSVQHFPPAVGGPGDRGSGSTRQSQVSGTSAEEKKWSVGASKLFSRAFQPAEETRTEGSEKRERKADGERGLAAEGSCTAVRRPAPVDVPGSRSRGVAFRVASPEEVRLTETDRGRASRPLLPAPVELGHERPRYVEGQEEEGAGRRRKHRTSPQKLRNSASPFWPEGRERQDGQAVEVIDSPFEAEEESKHQGQVDLRSRNWNPPLEDPFSVTEGDRRLVSRGGLGTPPDLSRNRLNPVGASEHAKAGSVEPAQSVFPSSSEGLYSRFSSDSIETNGHRGLPRDATSGYPAQTQLPARVEALSRIPVSASSLPEGEASYPLRESAGRSSRVAQEPRDPTNSASRHPAARTVPAVAQSSCEATETPSAFMRMGRRISHEGASESVTSGVPGIARGGGGFADVRTPPPDESGYASRGEAPSSSVGKPPLPFARQNGTQVASPDHAGEGGVHRNSAVMFQPFFQEQVVQEGSGKNDAGGPRGAEQPGGGVPLPFGHGGAVGIDSRTGLQTREDLQQSNIPCLPGVTAESSISRVTQGECYRTEKNPFASPFRRGGRRAASPARPSQGTPQPPSHPLSPFNPSQQCPSLRFAASGVSPTLASAGHTSFFPTVSCSAQNCSPASSGCSSSPVSSLSPTPSALQRPPASPAVPSPSALAAHRSPPASSLYPSPQQPRAVVPSYMPLTTSCFSSSSPFSSSSVFSPPSAPSCACPPLSRAKAPASQAAGEELALNPHAYTAVHNELYTPHSSCGFSTRGLASAGKECGTGGNVVLGAAPAFLTPSPPHAKFVQPVGETKQAGLGRSAIASTSVNPFAALCPQMHPYSPLLQSHRQPEISGQDFSNHSEQEIRGKNPLSPDVKPSLSLQDRGGVSRVCPVPGVGGNQSHSTSVEDAAKLISSTPSPSLSPGGGTSLASLSLTHADTRLNGPGLADARSGSYRATSGGGGFPSYEWRAPRMHGATALEPRGLSDEGRPSGPPGRSGSLTQTPRRDVLETGGNAALPSSGFEVYQECKAPTREHGLGNSAQPDRGMETEPRESGVFSLESGVTGNEEVAGLRKKQSSPAHAQQEEHLQPDEIPRFPSPTPR